MASRPNYDSAPRILAASRLVNASTMTVSTRGGIWPQAYRLGSSSRSERASPPSEQERWALEDQLASAQAAGESSAVEARRLEAALAAAVEASKRALAEQQERRDARLRSAFDRTTVVNVPSFVLGKLARTRSGRGDPGWCGTRSRAGSRRGRRGGGHRLRRPQPGGGLGCTIE